MKYSIYYIYLIASINFFGCADDNDQPEPLEQEGVMILKFDNVAGQKSAGLLSEVGDTDYPFTTSLDQIFNITLLRYFVSKVSLSGPNGENWSEELLVSADEINGYYLIDESDILSQKVNLEKVPAGTYNSVTFTIGVEQEGIIEGAAGGELTQGAGATDQDMFWNWNAGYLALKMEGQSASSPGEAFGETIEETNTNGFTFHVGGWNEPNNNKEITLLFDAIRVADNLEPEVHIVFDVLNLFSGVNEIDLSISNNVHSPASGVSVAENIPGSFQVDHVHQ